MANPTLEDKVRAKVGTRKELLRASLAELFGTFLLVLMVTAVVAQHVLPRKETAQNQLIGVNVGVALAIFVGIAVSARASGGHVNPAVTVAFLSVQQIKPLRAAAYIAAQCVGAFLGAAVTYFLYRDGINSYDNGIRSVLGTRGTAHIFASYPATHLSMMGGAFDQFLGAAVFLVVIAHAVDKRNDYPVWMQPVIIATGFLGIGTAFAYNCGYPLNPARDIAPRLFTLLAGYGAETFSVHGYCWFMIPVIAPLVGGVVGIWLYNLLVGFHGHPQAEYEIVATREMQPLAAKDGGENA